MHLEGSCHCGRVRFTVESTEPCPYLRCYCSICRKTAGTGGYAINIGADHRSFKLLQGKDDLQVYHAVIDGKKSPGQRHFCSHCGTALWMYDERWFDLIYLHASAIDILLPEPPENVHGLLDSKAPWVQVEGKPGDPRFEQFPDESLADWHRRHGL